jgi:hypothetical protein
MAGARHSAFGGGLVVGFVCDPDAVDRAGLSQLALIRFRLQTAATRFAKVTAGVDDPWVEIARGRLQVARDAVICAAGGLSRWTRTWICAAVLGSAGWATATFCGQVVGLSRGWTVTVTVVVALSLFWPVVVLNNALAQRINRRRTSHAEPPTAVWSGADSTADALVLLRIARTELVEVTRLRLATHRFGRYATTAAGFDWLRRRDRHLYWINQADRYVCEAIYSIELWLPSRVSDQ